MTSAVLYDAQTIRDAVERLKARARREATERVATDYLARGGTVPPTDEQQLATLTNLERAAHGAALGGAAERAKAMTDEELEAIHDWWQEAFFETASREDYEVDDRSEAAQEYLDRVLAELGLEQIALTAAMLADGSTLANLFAPGRVIFKLDDEDLGELCELVGEEAERRGWTWSCLRPGDVEEERHTRGYLYVDPPEGEDFVDEAVAEVLRFATANADGYPDEPEVARLDPADVENAGYVEVTLADGRWFAVSRPKPDGS